MHVRSGRALVSYFFGYLILVMIPFGLENLLMAWLFYHRSSTLTMGVQADFLLHVAWRETIPTKGYLDLGDIHRRAIPPQVPLMWHKIAFNEHPLLV
jgi:hypothetical protein